MNKFIGEIEISGIKSFETLEEAENFKKTLGDRYRRMYKEVYPEFELYFVCYDELKAELKK